MEDNLEYLEKWLKSQGTHPDDIEEIIEAVEEETTLYLRHDLYNLYDQYLQKFKHHEKGNA